jgi:hypothetical protein
VLSSQTALKENLLDFYVFASVKNGLVFMEVFISWSGTRSKYLASALRQWLSRVIQILRPWMSEEDIPAGGRWTQDVTRNLETAKFGIICLTPENLAEPWLLFEAGALAKLVDSSFVCPYLLGLEPEQIKGPLAQFQAKRANKADTFSLLRSINGRLNSIAPDTSLLGSDLEAAFDHWWPDLESNIQKVPEAGAEKAPERTDRDILIEVLDLTRELSRWVSAESTSRQRRLPVEDQTAFREYIRTKKAALAGFMELGARLELNGEVLKVIPRNDIYVRYLSDNKSIISALASEFYGRSIRAEIAPVENPSGGRPVKGLPS